MLTNLNAEADKSYQYWHTYFENKDITIVALTPDEHDRLAARSQGITHLLGRTLQKMGVTETPIDTLGFERLLGIMNQTCNDSWDLFQDLETYNPYSEPLLNEILTTMKDVFKSKY